MNNNFFLSPVNDCDRPDTINVRILFSPIRDASSQEMNSRKANSLSFTTPGVRATNQGTAGNASSSRTRLYTTSGAGDALGGHQSASDVRAAQETANKAKVALHEQKMEEIRKKKLEEKIAKYSYLLGNTLGKSDGRSMQQVREEQVRRNTDISSAAALKQQETLEYKKYSKEQHQELIQEAGTNPAARSLQEIRRLQQEKYNATMAKKSSS